MKIRIKLDLYALSILLQLCVKKKLGEGLSKSSEMVFKMLKGLLTKISILDVTTFSMKNCLASLGHRMEKCIESE